MWTSRTCSEILQIFREPGTKTWVQQKPVPRGSKTKLCFVCDESGHVAKERPVKQRLSDEKRQGNSDSKQGQGEGLHYLQLLQITTGMH